MLERLRPHLTYANIVASIALFAALGGGAYAAVTLPKNSVGSKQLKKNSVTSPKVKDGSLLARDFASGQLPAGTQGQKGDTGAQGPKGDTGTQGAKGDTGAPGADGQKGLDGTARAYGLVNTNGAVSRSKNVGTIDHTTNSGIYCIHLTGGVDPSTTGAVVEADLNGGSTSFSGTNSDDMTIAQWLSSASDCAAGTSIIEVRTGAQNFAAGAFLDNNATDEPFFLAVP